MSIRSFLRTCILLAAMLPSIASQGCTSFIISGRASKDGRPMIFKNRDASSANNLMLLVQGSTYKYVGLVTSASSSPSSVWAGHNEVGFAILNTAAYNLNGCEGGGGGNDGSIMRKALATCRTLKDFESMLYSMDPISANSNYAVLDAEGGCAYYETGHSSFVKFDANNPQDAPDGYIVRTNHGMTGCHDLDEGVERYTAISEFIEDAKRTDRFECEYLLANAPRYLTHGLTKMNLYDFMPMDETCTRMFPFNDFIPRYISTAAILIQGVLRGESPANTISWAQVGWPMAAVAIPLMVYEDVPLPSVVTATSGSTCWMSRKANEEKMKVFCLTRGKKQDYIDLAKLVNERGTGIAQRIIPFEAEVVRRGNEAIKKIRRGINGKGILSDYYTWVDQYVKENYPSKIEAFEIANR